MRKCSTILVIDVFKENFNRNICEIFMAQLYGLKVFSGFIMMQNCKC